MNSLAAAEQATEETRGDVDGFNFNPSTTAGCFGSFSVIVSLVAGYKIGNGTYVL